MRVVAFIPARGGSKRIPRKNLVRLASLPLIQHTIRCARQAEPHVPDPWRYVVSTEDAEIAAFVRDFDRPVGREVSEIEVHHRPPHLATDDAQIEDAIAHWAETAGDTWDAMVLLQPTSPLRRPETIRACLDSMGAGSAMATKDVDCFDHLKREAWSQSFDSGCVYAFKRSHWERHRCRYSDATVCVPIDRFEAWEIDDPLDLVVAEALLAARDA